MSVPAGQVSLVNTATAHYHPLGFPNDINDSDTHSVNLFQPSLAITKTGDDLPKIGDVVTYNIEVCTRARTTSSTSW